MTRSVYLAVLSAGNLLVNFMMQGYVFATVGAGRDMDALIAGMTIPQVVLAVVVGSLISVLVPLLSNEDAAALRRDGWTFLTIIGVSFLCASLALYWLAPVWVPLTVPGFSASTTEIAIALTRIQLASMVLIALSGVLTAVHHVKQRFLWPEIAPYLGAIIGGVLLVWGLTRFGVVVAAWVQVVRAAVHVVLLLPILGWFVAPDFSSGNIREAWNRLRPLVAGAAIYKTGAIVDRFLASMAVPGALSILYFGQQVFSLFGLVLNKSVTSQMVPQLARYAKSGAWRAFHALYTKRLLVVTGVTVAIYCLLLLFGDSVLSAARPYTNIAPDAIHLLWIVMIALGGVLIGGAMGQIVSPAFYAKGDTSTPTKVGVLGFAFGVTMEFIGFAWLGVLGIALALSVYYMLNATVLLSYLNRHIAGHDREQSRA